MANNEYIQTHIIIYPQRAIVKELRRAKAAFIAVAPGHTPLVRALCPDKYRFRGNIYVCFRASSPAAWCLQELLSWNISPSFN